MNKLRNVSRAFNLLFKVLLIIYPLLVISFWLGWISLPLQGFSMSHLPLDIDLKTVRFSLRVYAGLVDMIPVVFAMIGYFYLSKLFQLYSRNIIFSLQNVLYIRKIGFMLLFNVIAEFLVQPILSPILTFDAAPGRHLVSIGFGNHDFTNWIVALVVIVASWIMEEGRKLEEEQALTV